MGVMLGVTLIWNEITICLRCFLWDTGLNNNIMSILPWIGVIYLPLIIFSGSLAASVRHEHRKKIAVDPLLVFRAYQQIQLNVCPCV